MHLHWAAGLGLRLLTIVGAVRADLGFRLNRTGAQEPEPGGQYAFHLSLGEAY
jgi:outer membrane translocation and assembly module TamA